MEFSDIIWTSSSTSVWHKCCNLSLNHIFLVQAETKSTRWCQLIKIQHVSAFVLHDSPQTKTKTATSYKWLWIYNNDNICSTTEFNWVSKHISCTSSFPSFFPQAFQWGQLRASQKTQARDLWVWMVPLVWALPVDTISVLALRPKRQIGALRWGPAGEATPTTLIVQNISFLVVRITWQASHHPLEVWHVDGFDLFYHNMKSKDRFVWNPKITCKVF